MREAGRAITVLAALLALLSAAVPVGAAAGDEAGVLRAAQAGLKGWLGVLPQDELPLYGFANTGETARATLGTPLRIVTIPPADLAVAGSLSSLGGTLQETGQWYVPVLVDGGSRALLSVAPGAAGFKVVGISGALLARELGVFFAAAPAMAAANGITGRVDASLVRIFQAGCDLVYVKGDGRELLAPLASARRVLDLGEQWLEPSQVVPKISAAVSAALAEPQ